MNEADKKKYLKAWGDECFICKAQVERKDATLHKAIVELERYPEHADSTYIQYYMACPSCVKKGELL